MKRKRFDVVRKLLNVAHLYKHLLVNVNVRTTERESDKDKVRFLDLTLEMGWICDKGLKRISIFLVILNWISIQI